MSDNALNDTLINHITAMSEHDFQAFGADGLAYIRPADTKDNNEEPTFAIHAADGSFIAQGSDIRALRTLAMKDNRVAMLLQ